MKTKSNMNMMKAVWAVCACMAAFPACTDMMETDSTTAAFEEDNRLDSPNDSLYSVMGILSQVQRLGDRYVLLGELRGDLMEATADADVDIQEVSNFSVSEGNEFASCRDYYNVINNCNYALAKMDTTIVFYEDRVMVPEYAAIKAIRAWTYWQLGLATGRVSWIEEPILDLESALRDYPQKNLDELAALLIEDLTPHVGVRPLNYGTVDGLDSRKMFIPLDMMLGDLYLFLGRYAEAAAAYYRYIDGQDIVLGANGYYWMDATRNALMGSFPGTYATASSAEVLSILAYSTRADAYHPQLLRYAFNEKPSIVPSTTFVDRMARMSHYYAAEGASTIQGYFLGDLRGRADFAAGGTYPVSYGEVGLGDFHGTLIYKYYDISTSGQGGVATDPENDALGSYRVVRNLPIVRAPHVWLRLAEALNRYGRPATAFAVLAYGLNSTTLSNATRVPLWERTGEPFLDFTADTWADNVGTATRGRGRAIGNAGSGSSAGSDYLIPDYTPYDVVMVEDENTGEMVEKRVVSSDPDRLAAAKADSIEYVEDCIVDEMAAETAFEGNRFFDLMRIARHRGQWPAWAAGKVAVRFGDGAEAMRARLLDEDAWFVR